ncbi:sodium-dependent transporter [bacterium]|nr:sodium-dependent transporter [bacterium]
MSFDRGSWNTRLGFVLAAAGSAVGLGNIWKFPYITGENGGGWFVLIYLSAILLVGVPIMIAEVMIGRSSQKSPVSAFKILAGEDSNWRFVGWMGIAAGFVILSYYSVVAGWSLNYVLLAIMDTTHNQTPEQIGGLFGKLYADGNITLFWHFLFMSMTVGIVLGGVRKGIEKASRVLMPLLFILLLILVVYGFFAPEQGFMRTVRFIFYPDASKLTSRGVLEALGHAFFTLSLGMGAMLTYGSYLDRKEDLVRSSVTISILDTVVALMACFMIFPIVFGYGFEAQAGPGLVFKTMPIIFSQLPGGMILALMFFLLLTFAALTSAISLQEVVTSFFIDETSWSRRKATLLTGTIIFIFGVPSAYSGQGAVFGAWAEIFGMNFFDTMDYLASNWLLPAGGLLIALFAGWRMPAALTRAEFSTGSNLEHWYPIWRFILRWVTPILVAVVLLYKIQVLRLP